MDNFLIRNKTWKKIFSIIFFVLIVAVNFTVIAFGTKIKPIMEVRSSVKQLATDISTKNFKLEDVYAINTSIPQNREMLVNVNPTNTSESGLVF